MPLAKRAARRKERKQRRKNEGRKVISLDGVASVIGGKTAEQFPSESYRLLKTDKGDYIKQYPVKRLEQVPERTRYDVSISLRGNGADIDKSVQPRGDGAVEDVADILQVLTDNLSDHGLLSGQKLYIEITNMQEV